MDKQTVRKLHQVLAPLATHPWHRATFIATKAGEIVFHFGVSDALRLRGEEVSSAVRSDDAEDSLYLTGLGDTHLLGVLFDHDEEVDGVRDTVAALLPKVDAQLSAG